jgi:DNA-3-methyladenine glycosylase I
MSTRPKVAADPVTRCRWASNEWNIPYHDREWGVPVHDDRVLFEFLILEGAQAGLSWDTILRKRDRYREVFDNFDPRRIARYDAKKVRSLLRDPGIVRNRLKISATVSNARAFLKVQEEVGSFDAYIWKFVGGRTETESLDGAQWSARENSGVGRHKQGFKETWISLRRLDDLLRLHASRWHGQRPCHYLLSLLLDEINFLVRIGFALRLRLWFACLGLGFWLAIWFRRVGLASSVFGAIATSSTSKISAVFGPISCRLLALRRPCPTERTTAISSPLASATALPSSP